ncbi:MAG: hypothetical protein KAS32_25850 [Candidatus Peribacteraceae bacterium]|nr:hypothetical protein [Candidatus Peribacteraceae bacterium]
MKRPKKKDGPFLLCINSGQWQYPYGVFTKIKDLLRCYWALKADISKQKGVSWVYSLKESPAKPMGCLSEESLSLTETGTGTVEKITWHKQSFYARWDKR